MKYPKIVSFGIKDFRNIAKAELSFKESPIVCLTGENESGKSSFTIASAVLGVHAYPTKQAEFVRNGTSGFTLLMNFEDGTAVYRKKNSNGNFYGVIKDGSIIWEVNKIDPGGVPYEVQKVMGMIIEPETKEYMNIRTYRDLLLFVETTGGTNYKVIYNALKVDVLYRSLRIGTIEYNSLKQKVAREEQGIQTLQTQLRSIRLIDLEPAILIKNRLSKELQQLKNIRQAIEIADKINHLKAVSKEILELYNLPEINESEMTTLQLAYRNFENMNKLINDGDAYKKVEELESVEIPELTALRAGFDNLNRLEGLENSNVYKDIELIGEVSEIEFGLLNSGMKMLSSLYELRDRYNIWSRNDLILIDTQIDSSLEQAIQLSSLLDKRKLELSSVDKAVKDAEAKIKDCGALVTTCSNCGETIVMPIQ